MIPFILTILGGYLIGDSMKNKEFSGGGKITEMAINDYSEIKPGLSTYEIYRASENEFEVYSMRDISSAVLDLKTMKEVEENPKKLFDIDFN